ncbi:hypothetical protein [Spiroplasma endosymbiont of Cantharis lateralis]|uniref:hypothetical protein n=1 Tax=Spiroplasma endosymbiont of Cantharis lateralis TaxID=3066277 RepID=UPI00313B2941
MFTKSFRYLINGCNNRKHQIYHQSLPPRNKLFTWPSIFVKLLIERQTIVFIIKQHITIIKSYKKL